MSGDDTGPRGMEASDDDLTFTRRTALALLGATGVGAATGDAAAATDGGGTRATADAPPARKWEQDVDAQDHDLENLGSVQVEDVYTAARGADVVVWKDDDGVFHADGHDGQVASGDDVLTVTQAAVDSLTDGRDWKETVAVVSPGTATGETSQIELPSYTVLDVPARIRIPYDSSGRSPDVSYVVHADGVEHVEVRNLTVTGALFIPVRISHASNVELGDVRILADEGTNMNDAVRIDGRGDGPRTTDVQVERVYVENANHHAFETYGVDRIEVGQVIARNVAGCGVLLNDTADASVGQVVGYRCNPEGGYAAFRVANFAHDVTCGQVVANECGRGVFGVSGCRNITIGEVNLRETNSQGVLIQDCQNFTVGGGVVENANASGVRIDSRSGGGIPEDPRDFAATSGVTVTDLRIVDSRDEPKMAWGIQETGPDTETSRIVDNDVRGSGTQGAIDVFAPDSVVRDNVGGGLAVGTVTLSAGSSPAARVEDVGDALGQSLSLRSRAASDPGDAFAYDHEFVWTGSAWDLVFTWSQDPGTDLDVDYIVDQQQAEGFVPAGSESGGSSGGQNGAADLSGDLVDSFEDGDLSEYFGATDAYAVNTDAPVADGEYSAKKTADGTAIIASTSGLPRYPRAGDTFFARAARTDVENNACVAFGMQDTQNFYFARIYNGDEFEVYKRENGSYTKLAKSHTSNPIEKGALYTFVVDWGTDGAIDVELLDPEGASVGTVSASDTTFTEGGVGTRRTGVLEDIRVM